MIRSMTAYVRKDAKGEWGNAVWELRSVNHRYLEIKIRLPEQFRNLDPVIRKRLRNHVMRGKVECNLHFEPDFSTQDMLTLNQPLAKQLLKTIQWMKKQNENNGDIDLVDILRWPNMISMQDQNSNAINTKLLDTLDLTITDFISVREHEGAILKTIIEQRLKNSSTEVQKVRSRIPEILQWQRKQLINKLKEAEIQVDNHRIEQELLILAQRIDVAEELDRIDAHIKSAFNILKKEESIGRYLDFIMQELNRESNTVASKSINKDVTASAIELKVLIEQIREQVQNIE